MRKQTFDWTNCSIPEDQSASPFFLVFVNSERRQGTSHDFLWLSEKCRRIILFFNQGKPVKLEQSNHPLFGPSAEGGFMLLSFAATERDTSSCYPLFICLAIVSLF